MNSVKQDLIKNIKLAEKENKQIVLQDRHSLKFHLMPPVGWLNDPNGLCYFKGQYHVFFQYSPFDPTGGQKFWGHYVSSDLLNWEYVGVPFVTDEVFDSHGVYSGCAMVDEDKMHIYYTGNVKYPGDYDYITAGRGANTVYSSSEDGIHFEDKRCLMENKDYPDHYTCHIRDPKVWKEDDKYYMVLGGRRVDDHGAVLVYESTDRMNWSYCNEITTVDKFGYMWECPDLFKLDGEWILSISPQGLEHEEYQYQNVYQSGYYKLTGEFTDDHQLSSFTEWDMGFDFYAPQTFTDSVGRRILIGWAGLPDIDYTNPTVEHVWQHALTVPRQLTLCDGKVLQYPVKEMEQLRTELVGIKSGEEVVLEEGIFDLLLSTSDCSSCKIVIEEGLCLFYHDGIFEMKFEGELGSGRTSRKARIPQLKNVRVLADTSLLEVYVNDGEYVFTTRYYKKDKKATLQVDCVGSTIVLWKLKGMEVII